MGLFQYSLRYKGHGFAAFRGFVEALYFWPLYFIRPSVEFATSMPLFRLVSSSPFTYSLVLTSLRLP